MENAPRPRVLTLSACETKNALASRVLREKELRAASRNVESRFRTPRSALGAQYLAERDLAVIRGCETSRASHH